MLSLMQPANLLNKAYLCYYKLFKFHNKPILCISNALFHARALKLQLNTNELKR